ncbi:MAG: hypothetical protein ACRBBK_07350 [Paracoccaceae bacterium]
MIARQEELSTGSQADQPIRLSERVFAAASRLLNQGRATEAADQLELFIDKKSDVTFEVAQRLEGLVLEAAGKIRDIFGELSYEEYLRRLRRNHLRNTFAKVSVDGCYVNRSFKKRASTANTGPSASLIAA